MEPTDKGTLLMVMSEFAITLTKSEYKIIRLRQRVENYIEHHEHLQHINTEKLETIRDSLIRNNDIPHVHFEKQFYLWLTELMKYLEEVEFFGRTISWKVFKDFINHLYIFRSPIIREDHQIRLPICNITFPEDKLNNLTHTMPKIRNKTFVKTNRCKRSQIPNVCG